MRSNISLSVRLSSMKTQIKHGKLKKHALFLSFSILIGHNQGVEYDWALYLIRCWKQLSMLDYIRVFKDCGRWWRSNIHPDLYSPGGVLFCLAGVQENVGFLLYLKSKSLLASITDVPLFIKDELLIGKTRERKLALQEGRRKFEKLNKLFNEGMVM